MKPIIYTLFLSLFVCGCFEKNKEHKMIVKYSEIPGKKLAFIENENYIENKSNQRFDKIYKITEVEIRTSLAESTDRESSYVILTNDRKETIKILFNLAVLPDRGFGFKIGKSVGVSFDDKGKVENYMILDR